jgi:ribosomal protein L3 glutamine methyltransferase
MRSLPPEYRHEPALGLAGGEDGMALVARLLEPVAERLAPEGLLIGEVGASAPALLRRFPDLPFVWPDLETGGEGVFVLMAPA